MSTKKEREQPHTCQTEGCTTLTFYRYCARCSCQQEDERQAKRDRYRPLSYSMDQAQARHAKTWNERKDE
jgi:hypothetical protein